MRKHLEDSWQGLRSIAEAPAALRLGDSGRKIPLGLNVLPGFQLLARESEFSGGARSRHCSLMFAILNPPLIARFRFRRVFPKKARRKNLRSQFRRTGYRTRAVRRLQGSFFVPMMGYRQ